MELLVVERFDGSNMGVFPLFPKGTVLEFVGKGNESSHWCPCITKEGHGFWTPDTYLDGMVLNRDYNPTSLTVETGQTLTLKKIVFEWLYVTDEKGIDGWIPANIVVSACNLEENDSLV